jgi:hypothetical protein
VRFQSCFKIRNILFLPDAPRQTIPQCGGHKLKLKGSLAIALGLGVSGTGSIKEKRGSRPEGASRRVHGGQFRKIWREFITDSTVGRRKNFVMTFQY